MHASDLFSYMGMRQTQKLVETLVKNENKMLRLLVGMR